MEQIDNSNKTLAYDLLFRDPETHEELRPKTVPYTEGNNFCLIVSNKEGTRTWRHYIKTEEV